MAGAGQTADDVAVRILEEIQRLTWQIEQANKRARDAEAQQRRAQRLRAPIAIASGTGGVAVALAVNYVSSRPDVQKWFDDLLKSIAGAGAHVQELPASLQKLGLPLDLLGWAAAIIAALGFVLAVTTTLARRRRPTGRVEAGFEVASPVEKAALQSGQARYAELSIGSVFDSLNFPDGFADVGDVVELRPIENPVYAEAGRLLSKVGNDETPEVIRTALNLAKLQAMAKPGDDDS